jgi:ubiquinone biosynthesis protein
MTAEAMPAAGFRGSFLEPGPWDLDLSTMQWRADVPMLRAESRARVPALIAPRRLPPARVLHVAAALTAAGLPSLVRKWKGGRSDIDQRAALAVDVRRAFQHLGATFIKLGQLIAGAEGLLPDEIVAAFSVCRDQMPAEPFEHVRSVVESDLRAPLEATFADFDTTPIAAASIAQVHAARLLSDEHVVVKVQRPGLDKIVASDLAATAWVIRVLESRAEQAKALNLGAYLELLAETLSEELDFRLEAQNMLDLAEVLSGTAGPHRVVVPRPHPNLVTKRVLVMERLHGCKVDAVADLNRTGADASEILTALLISFFEGSLIHGVFHGDMHGGNMLVTTAGTPALLDMGVTGRFAPAARPHLVRLLMSPNDATRDKLKAFQELGGFPADIDLDHIEALLAAVDAKKQSQPSTDDMAVATREFLADVVRLGARIPKELFLFVRGVLYLNGALAALGSDIDLPTAFTSVVSHLADQHGDQLAEEAGLDPEQMRRDAEDAQRQMRDELGRSDDTGRVTFQDMKAARTARGAL